MKKGDVMVIYEDPVTELKPEGKAKLLSLAIDDKAVGKQYWKVRFLSDGFVTHRWIKEAA